MVEALRTAETGRRADVCDRTPKAATPGASAPPTTPFSHHLAQCLRGRIVPPALGEIGALQEQAGIKSSPVPVTTRGLTTHRDDAAPSAEPAEPLGDEERRGGRRERWTVTDPTDPLVRTLHANAPFEPALFTPTAPATGVSTASRVSLEHVLPQLLRRIAWSGDARAGTARLEFGHGQLEGATLVVHSEGGAVRVHLEVPPGVDAAEWKARIGRRLEMRGLQVAELEVS